MERTDTNMRRLGLAAALAACLLMATAAPAGALAWRGPQTQYAAAGLGHGASGGPTYSCHDAAATIEAHVSARGIDANGSRRYDLAFHAVSPCARIADTCRGVEQEDGTIRGGCLAGAAFTISNWREQPLLAGAVDLGRVSFDLAVRSTLPLPAAGGPVALAAWAPMEGAGVEVLRTRAEG